VHSILVCVESGWTVTRGNRAPTDPLSASIFGRPTAPGECRLADDVAELQADGQYL
jgi:hypothetical protein